MARRRQSLRACPTGSPPYGASCRASCCRDSLVALPPGRDAGCDALLQQHGAILSLSYPLSAINAVPSVPRKVPPIKHGAAPPFTPGRRAIRFDPGGIHQQRLLLCRCAIDQASSENSKVQTPYRPTAETVVEGFVGSMHGRGIHASAAHRGARGRCRQQLAVVHAAHTARLGEERSLGSPLR